MACSAHAITQGFNALKADEDAQKEMVSFFVDLAMAGLPTDKLNDRAAEVIGGLFTNPNVTEALKGVSGNLIDEGTGRLTDAAKDVLYKTLGQEETDRLDQQAASNALRSACFGTTLCYPRGSPAVSFRSRN